MVFTHLATFARSARGLFDETDLFELELALLLTPEAGTLFPVDAGSANFAVRWPGVANAAAPGSSTTMLPATHTFTSCLPGQKTAGPI